MSDINGKGYGDKHDWENIETEQMPIPQDRSTLYVCRTCKESFRHYYHITENIFDAMEKIGVNEYCRRR